MKEAVEKYLKQFGQGLITQAELEHNITRLVLDALVKGTLP